MKATRTTLHRQFSWNVRFLSLGFPVLDCRLILDHSDMPVGAEYSFETLTRKYVARQTFSTPGTTARRTLVPTSTSTRLVSTSSAPDEVFGPTGA